MNYILTTVDVVLTFSVLYFITRCAASSYNKTRERRKKNIVSKYIIIYYFIKFNSLVVSSNIFVAYCFIKMSFLYSSCGCNWNEYRHPVVCTTSYNTPSTASLPLYPSQIEQTRNIFLPFKSPFFSQVKLLFVLWLIVGIICFIG